MPSRIFFRTFGCKTNQYDSALIGQSLEAAGFSLAGGIDDADWVVVNTCAVTKRGEDKARQWVRSVAREHPTARIAVVGCSVEANGERFAGIEGVRLLLGTEEKFRLGEVLGRYDEDTAGQLSDTGESETRTQYADLPVLQAHPGRARGYVKIQDGCDNRCTYCIVPLVRGASRSRPAGQVADEVAGLEQAGHAEAVLTGIHIGKYGKDLDSGRSLAGLVREVLSATEKIRIRLSSVEVVELDDELISLVAGNPRVCNHMHIPLQHGSDRILERMDRKYTAAEFESAVRAMAARVDCMGLGTDVIVGFPGETEQDFRATYDLIESLPFSYLHVFPYSPRPGTPAAEMKERPAGDVVRERVGALRSLSKDKSEAFRSGLRGKRLEVIREQTGKDGISQCRADNYALVYCREKCPGGCFLLEAGDVRGDGLWGSLTTQRD